MKKIIIIILCIAVAIGLWSATKYKIPDTKYTTQNSSNSVLPEGTEQTFSSPTGDFSFTYVAPYVLSNLFDESGDIFLLQKEGSGVQVYVTDFTDGGTFNASRVKKELLATASGEVLGNFQDIQMPGGFPAVTFSTKTSTGEGWDVWFVREETLYQITADPNHDDLLKKIVETWRFE